MMAFIALSSGCCINKSHDGQRDSIDVYLSWYREWILRINHEKLDTYDPSSIELSFGEFDEYIPPIKYVRIVNKLRRETVHISHDGDLLRYERNIDDKNIEAIEKRKKLSIEKLNAALRLIFYSSRRR